MNGVSDAKGIPGPKLEHIFLGTVKGNRVSGYHCDSKIGDEKVYAEIHAYPKSKRTITVNGNLKLFEAVVKEKVNGRVKTDNGGKSSFFAEEWPRQKVVDCIARLKSAGKLIKKYNLTKKHKEQCVFVDPRTGMVVVDNDAGSYPVLRY